jgi:branched-chain amino acid transport system ATP-binding protein
VLLRLDSVKRHFGGVRAVDGVSLEVEKGSIQGLIGPNGAGKTTLVNVITGYMPFMAGRAFLEDDELTGRPAHRIAALGVARTFQNIRLFGGMTVLENLMVAQHNKLMLASAYTVGGLFGLSAYRTGHQAALDLALYWLEQVHLIERADDHAADLPYGAQRRLEIARAMCTEPLLLCLDEPAAGLNPRESTELNDLLRFIREKHGISVLLIEHDMGVVMEISDHIVVLDYGEKISDGSAEFVRNDPRVIAAYLGVEDEAEVAAVERSVL